MYNTPPRKGRRRSRDRGDGSGERGARHSAVDEGGSRGRSLGVPRLSDSSSGGGPLFAPPENLGELCNKYNRFGPDVRSQSLDPSDENPDLLKSSSSCWLLALIKTGPTSTRRIHGLLFQLRALKLQESIRIFQ